MGGGPNAQEQHSASRSPLAQPGVTVHGKDESADFSHAARRAVVASGDEHTEDTDCRGYEIRMRYTLFWTKAEKYLRAAICDAN
jgi:hypothetical protein